MDEDVGGEGVALADEISGAGAEDEGGGLGSVDIPTFCRPIKLVSASVDELFSTGGSFWRRAVCGQYL